jgi:maleate cis-trans isomerase
VRADAPDAQALVLSCTDMRAVEVIDRLQRSLGKPVITSNQALMEAAKRALKLE